MNLDRVIEILTSDQENLLISSVADLRLAKKIGIEALKLYMALKATGGVPRGFSGIGETKD